MLAGTTDYILVSVTLSWVTNSHLYLYLARSPFKTWSEQKFSNVIHHDVLYELLECDQKSSTQLSLWVPGVLNQRQERSIVVNNVSEGSRMEILYLGVDTGMDSAMFPERLKWPYHLY